MSIHVRVVMLASIKASVVKSRVPFVALADSKIKPATQRVNHALWAGNTTPTEPGVMDAPQGSIIMIPGRYVRIVAPGNIKMPWAKPAVHYVPAEHTNPALVEPHAMVVPMDE